MTIDSRKLWSIIHVKDRNKIDMYSILYTVY